MKNTTLEFLVFSVLIALIVLSGLAGYGVSLQGDSASALELEPTPVYKAIPLETPKTTFYEDISGVIDYGTYQIHFSDGNAVEIWFPIGLYNTACDGLAWEQYCVLVGDDSRQEFAKELGLW